MSPPVVMSHNHSLKAITIRQCMRLEIVVVWFVFVFGISAGVGSQIDGHNGLDARNESYKQPYSWLR